MVFFETQPSEWDGSVMKLPRDLSGAEIVDCLCRHWSFERIHQTGSHIIIDTELPGHQRIAVRLTMRRCGSGR